MSQLHERVRLLDSSDNDQVKETLTQYFQKLARNTESDHSEWLNNIELILIRFPKNCLQHRSTIENYLVQFLDSEHESWVIGAAKCCHALQQVRPSNDKSATAKSSWRQQMALLCSTAHDLMGTAFSDAIDIYKATGYFQKSVAEENSAASTVLGAALSQLSVASARLTSPSLAAPRHDFVALGPAERSALLCKRLRNVLTFVQAMLVEVYPVAKPVRPQSVLDVLVRALSVSGGAAGAGGVAAAVARVKAHALRTLDALVLCLGSNLIPYSPLLFRLITQTLRWCADQNTQESQNIRRSSYESLALWLSSLQCHKLEGEAARGRGVSLEEELLTKLLDDVAPRTQLIQLTMSNQFTKNLGKKAKRKMANTMLSQSGIAHHIPGEKNKEITAVEDPQVVLAALRCLEILLTTSGIFLKPATHKKVQECLVRQCYSVSPEERGSARGLALCRALEASRLATPASLAPPTHHCLAIYSRLHIASDTRLAQFCSRALLAVRSSLHSAPATLSFAPPPPLPQSATDPTTPATHTTERNRAALAALLGDHKLPPPKQSEEIITVLDDALNRKRKADDDDQISVSSQSSNVVEIDESNGVDLDSPGTNFEDPIEVDEIDCIPEPAVFNGKMKLLDFDDKEKDVLNRNGVIHELPTQMPHNASSDSVAVENDDSDCVEVSYDHGGEVEESIKYLERLDGDHLPSTGDTDDIQITCGQTMNSSQESGIEKTSSGIPINKESPVNVTETVEVETSETVMIEVIKKPEVGAELGTSECVATSMDEVVSAQDGAVNVDDMLADFVDEKAEG